MENDIYFIFDYDGTIFDTSKAIVACVKSTLENSIYKDRFNEKDIVKTIGMTLEDSFRYVIDGVVTKTEIENFCRLYRDTYTDFSKKYAKPYEGIQQSLEEIKNNNIEIFLVSNKGEHALRNDLERFNLLQMFSAIFGAESLCKKKPDPEVFTKHIQPRVSQNADIYVVGDTPIDIEFARRIHAKIIWARYGFGDKGRCRELQPDYEITSAYEIVSVIKNLI